MENITLIRKSIFILLIYILITPFALAQNPKYEMRGVWVATVANIDWPSKPGLKPKQQKQEIIDIVTNTKKLGLNCIFLQVRPASDVLYNSQFEPWSEVLTGTQGQHPKYDPLEFWIEQAHKNGLELHAWINPYRASMSLKKELHEKHPYHQHPELFVEYGGKLYYNPGEPESNSHINKVVNELVDNYNIDGIHMDDYFYPYPVAGQSFPDSSQFVKYGKDFSDINAWRRNNVDNTIESLRHTIKSSKPWLQFGISPFGVWRNKEDDPKGSDSRAGITNYDGLHADILLWMENKWIDYVVPQLYWGTSHPVANYNKLSDWWNENHFNIPVYIGHGLYRVGSDNKDWQNPEQLPFQMQSVRDYQNLSGSVFFSYKHFNRDLIGFQDTLQNNFYSTKAIVPHIDKNKVPNKEKVLKIKANKRRISWKTSTDNSFGKYILYIYDSAQAFNPDDTSMIFDISYSRKYKLPKKKTKLRKQMLVRIASIDNYNTEGTISQPVVFKY